MVGWSSGRMVHWLDGPVVGWSSGWMVHWSDGSWSDGQVPGTPSSFT